MSDARSHVTHPSAGPERRQSTAGLVKNWFYRVLFVLVRNLPPGYFRPFPWGQALRGLVARGLLEECGKHVNIEMGCHFGNGTGIRLGDHSGIGIRAEINPHVTIGRYVMMAPDVAILTQNHLFDDVTEPMCFQGKTDWKPVIIEDDVWIGQRAIILPGVRIGKGSIIGAGAVVSRSVPPYSVAVGNPARVVRSRLPEEAASLAPDEPCKTI